MLRQPTGRDENHAALVAVGWGLILILLLLVSRQLVIERYAQYQLDCLITSLQRRATLERQLYGKPSRPASQKGLSQQP